MNAMKKSISALFLTLSLVFATCMTASADEYSPAVFKTTPFDATQSGTVSTTLYLEEGSNLIDFEFQLSYDTEFVTLQDAVQADNLMGDMEITQKDGAVHISYTRTSSNLTEKTDLAVLTFLVDENVGPDAYEFLSLDKDYQHEAHTMVEDDLFILPIETDFANLDIYNIGDVNLSHNVSIADVTNLRQYLAEMRELSAYQLSLSDAYYDTEVSIADAVRIQQYLADKTMLLGNRVNVTFLDKDQNPYRVKSVPFGGGLASIPELPEYSGYYGGVWSTDPQEIVGTDFQNLEDALTVYAIYKKDASDAVTFYKERLTEVYYSQSTLTGNLNLVNKLTYQDGYTADIYWSSSDSSVLNASTGVFTKPSYDTKVTLTATIISYQDGTIEAQDYIAFEYSAAGYFLCPTKDEIAAYLSGLFGETIDYNMTLPSKVTNEDIDSDSQFEVRLDWIQRNADGTEQSVVQLARSNHTQEVTLIAVATFDGQPLEGDGKIYFDNIILEPVSEEEVRSHIINQIALNTGLSVTEGQELLGKDEKYGATITWISQNTSVATIENNVVSIKDVVNGTALPIEVEVTYDCGGEPATIKLAYTVNVATDNALLVPGTNIDPALYDALKSATGVYGNLTTNALKNVKFVYLDLSGYPEIKDLSALTYCSNLRVLNISGLKVDETSLNQIATLNKLEALIANNCGISSMTVGGAPVLDKMINLKMLDLAHNNLTSLDSVLSKDNRYGQLQELYLNDNQLTDISALCEITEETVEILDGEGEVVDTYTENVVTNRAPMLRFLILDNNHLKDDDLAAFGNFKLLKYLSLGNNDLTSVSNLKDIRSLLELHLQGNRIEDVRDLRFLVGLQSLYLSDNNIRNVFSGANEVNVSYLKYLKDLEILYLNDNDIEDISDLETLSKLMVLNVNNNRIQDLSALADKGETLVELYAENNEIDSFSFVRDLTGLKQLMLANNGSVYESSLNSYLSGLTKLKTLTLSGKDLRSLEFLNHMSALVRLDVANCNLPSYYPGTYTLEGTELAVSSYIDNVAAIRSLKSSLRYLDVSNNGLAYGAEGMGDWLKGVGAAGDVKSVSFPGAAPMTFESLYEMTNLKVLYADNLADPVDAAHLFSVMTGLNYLSMENCGIEDANWLSKFRGLVYVDLSGNELTSFDLGSDISLRSRGTLEYLYIDSNTACKFPDAFAGFDGNVLKEFSAANVKVNVMDYMPDMTQLEYLNLSNSGITNLKGSNPDFDGWFDLSRYQAVKTLDVTGVQADLDEVKELDNLETLYAIGDVEDQVFQKDTLLDLYDLHNAGVECYLYDYALVYTPKAEVEGGRILSTLKDYSADLTVAAKGMISDNNPTLPESVNGFDIEWTVSNDDNYAIVDNQIAVADYTDIDDEVLILTATIDVYPDQAPVSREYKMDMTILRPDMSYLVVDATGADSYLTRLATFKYDVTCVAGETKGFSQPVLPVYTDIKYSYTAVLDEESLPYTNFVAYDEETHSHVINEDATIRTVLTIRVNVGHAIGEDFVTDQYIEKVIKISAQTYKLTFVTNGGTITANVDGSTFTETAYPEETVLFEDITVARPGFLFNGWYTDADCTELFWKEGEEAVTMPSSDLTLYADWIPYSFDVLFDANGGAVAKESMPVLCGTPYGALPTPTRDGHTFQGWFTQADGGTQITSDMIVEIEADQTLYAQWTVNDYTITLETEGTVEPGQLTVTYGQSYGTLPTPTRTGFIFNGWFTEETGGGMVTADTLVEITDDQTLYAQWTPMSYTAKWASGTGYTIVVNRTSSPYADAATGKLSSGATVYYGDVLSVSYNASTGYTLSGKGSTSITVTGNITSSNIYATATANQYTYNVVYKSSNGTSLGSTTYTYAYGTTNKITPPAYSGYTTPSAQSVAWDSTSAKTIAFTYTPNSVSATKATGSICSNPKITYSAVVSYRNRTADSVQLQVKWTNTIAAYGYYYYAQKFDAAVGSVGTGRITVASYGTWTDSNTSSSAKSKTATSGWITVPVSATTTGVSMKLNWYATNSPGTVLDSGSKTVTVKIPTY